MTTANFTIRSATPHDVPLILAFIKELASYEKLSHEVIATEQLLQKALFGPDAHTEVILGYLGEQPVSFAHFFHNFSTFLGRSGIVLEDIYVKPEARGQGLGKRMFAHIAQLAKQRHCGRLEWVVLNWNEPAINFYESLGAKPMDEWTTYRLTGQALTDLADNKVQEEEFIS